MLGLMSSPFGSYSVQAHLVQILLPGPLGVNTQVYVAGQALDDASMHGWNELDTKVRLRAELSLGYETAALCSLALMISCI